MGNGITGEERLESEYGRGLRHAVDTGGLTTMVVVMYVCVPVYSTLAPAVSDSEQVSL